MLKINMKQIFLLGIAIWYPLFFTGCLPNEQPDYVKEMQARFLKELENGEHDEVFQMGDYDPYKIKKQIPILAPMSQAELNNKIDEFGIATNQVNFTRTKSGFMLNGKQFVDYEGTIAQVSFNSVNGFTTYLVEVSSDVYIMKFMQANAKLEPISIANVMFDDGLWKVNSVTGKKLTGHNFQLGSNGFIITRNDGTGFISEHKIGVEQINIPQGYQVAKFQNGDVVGTKTILLEIPEVVQEEGSISSIFSKAKALGSMLGVNKKEDYAFLDLNSGKLIKINIPNDGKSKLECLQYGERINQFVSKCLKYADPVESLYAKDGTKNFNHYYWRIKWFNTVSGVVALTQEDDLGKIYATNLSTGKKVLVKRYLPGYSEFDAYIQSNGKLKLSAKKGMLGSDDIEDIESDIKNLPTIIEEIK